MSVFDDIKRLAEAAERLCGLFEAYLKSQNIATPAPQEDLEPQPYRLTQYDPAREFERQVKATFLRQLDPELSADQAYERVVEQEKKNR